MANGRLSFSIALNLASQGFKQGAAQVKNALRNIQYQVLGMASALGLGGIGLSNLVSRFIDVARETNRARMALRNISADSAAFGVNMNYLTNLAQQYGQNLNTLTSNFSRFSAASNVAGVGIKEQQEIYSSVTKAITAFGLSGEEANLTFMALGQMMAKGKISSEELRRQMGERIPTAMQAMANAAGVSIQQLDKMLKSGDIYSKDILPKFAKELDKLTGTINLDNLETSVNRLSTAFIKLTEDLRIGEFYKKLVDGATNALSNIQSLLTTFAGVVVGGILSKLIKGYITYSAAAVASHNRVALSAQQSVWRQELALSGLTKAQQRELIKQRTAAMMAFQASEGAAKKFAITAKAALATVKTAFMSIAPMALLMAIGAIVGKIIEARREAAEIRKLTAQYNDDIARAGSDQTEIVRIKAIVSALNDKKRSHETIKSLQTELMGILGMEVWNREEVNAKLTTKIRLLKEAARAEVAANKIANTESVISELAASVGLNSSDTQNLVTKLLRKGINIQSPGFGMQRGKDASATYGALSDLGIDTSNIRETNKLIDVLAKTAKLNHLLNRANVDLQNAIAGGISTTKTPTPSGGGGGGITTGGGGGGQADDAAEAALQALASSLSASSGDLLSPEDVSKLAGIKRYVPIEGVRDTTFDYKKSDLDILEEKKELLSDYIKNLKDEAPHALELIKQKEGELTTLSEALKLQELKDDIEKFKDEIDDLNKDILLKSIDGFTGLANSIDSIANSWKRVASADMNGWERMVAIINAMGDSVKGITSAWEAYLTIKGLIDAKEKASALQKVATATMEASAARVEAEANIAAGSAKTFNAHAGIPFVGIGIAAAGIAAMIALIAKSRNSIPKYADGGIIGGTSYTGDKVLGRFNSGEMVITRADQRNLSRAIKSGNFGGGNVEFVIKGKDLVGTLNQQQQRASRR